MLRRQRTISPLIALDWAIEAAQVREADGVSTDAQLLNQEQVAECLQVSEYTALKWLRQGRINGRKFGKFWRVKAEDLEAFINHPPALTLVDPPPAPTPLTNGTAPTPTPSAEAPPARKATLLPRLQALHAEGLSSQQIAHRLNPEGVPTLSGRGQWQRGTVANLLAEAEGAR
jgi:excisionase family DNA binding protein